MIGNCCNFLASSTKQNTKITIRPESDMFQVNDNRGLLNTGGKIDVLSKWT